METSPPASTAQHSLARRRRCARGPPPARPGV